MTHPDAIAGDTEANDESLQSGRFERHRAGPFSDAAKKPTPHPSAFIRPWR
jgi:hypothetical protein